MSTVLLTLDEAAERLRTTRSALHKKMQRGEIDHVRLGRNAFMMTERQIEDHIARCTIARRPPPGVGTFQGG